jgi:hypothetical protein
MPISRAGLAGLLVSLVAVPVAGADVTVRVESPDANLVLESVARTGSDVTKAGVTCGGASAAGAFDRVVGAEDWDANNFGGSLFISRILGLTLSFDGPKDTWRYWGFDHNNRFSEQGICEYLPSDGDELLFYAACGDATATACFDGKPLDVVAPSTAPIGKAFTVRVDQYDDATGSPSPAAGATISGGDDDVTTGADGTAKVTVSDEGSRTLRATLGKQVPDEASVDVGGGDYAIPEDTAAPKSRILRLKNGAKLKKGPRTLRARVTDASALRAVTLGLTRRVGKKCASLTEPTGKFVKTKCSRHPRFRVGTAKKVSYLLPKRLGPGRYTLDVRAVDKLGNREKTKRGRNRVVFTVK